MITGRGDGMAEETRLTVTVWDDPRDADAAPRRWELTEAGPGGPAGGTHPDPAAACRAIAGARRPFDPVPADAMCTQIYGGPQRAVVEGVWRGVPVTAEYSRTDGCEIARWNALAAVLDPGD